MERRKPKALWDVEKMVSDMAVKGWNTPALARAAGLTYKTTDRFLTREVQTPKTAARIAQALGYATKRYLVGVEAAA